MFLENHFKWKKVDVDDELKRAKDRTLRNIGGENGGKGFMVVSDHSDVPPNARVSDVEEVVQCGTKSRVEEGFC